MLKKLFKKFAEPQILETTLIPDSDWLGYYASYQAVKSWTGHWHVHFCAYVSPHFPGDYNSISKSLNFTLDRTPVTLDNLHGKGTGDFYRARQRQSMQSFGKKEDAIAFMKEWEQSLSTTSGRFQTQSEIKRVKPVKNYYI